MIQFRTFLPVFIALTWPLATLSQEVDLPEYAYDKIAEITMATTAAGACDGARLKDRKLQIAMVDLMGRLAADGFDPVTSVQHFETETGKSELDLREAALRRRHSVAPEGTDALCDAIRAEVKINPDLASFLRLR